MRAARQSRRRAGLRALTPEPLGAVGLWYDDDFSQTTDDEVRGAFAFADGFTALVVAIQGGERHYLWLLVLDRVFGIGIGFATIFWPAITMLTLIFLVGIRFVVMGALQLAAASRIRDEVKSQVLYALGGVASLLTGILAFLLPALPRSSSSRCSVRSRSSSES
jgi:hypothetical protein